MKWATIILTTLFTILSAQSLHAVGLSDGQSSTSESGTTLVAGRFRRGGHWGRFGSHQRFRGYRPSASRSRFGPHRQFSHPRFFRGHLDPHRFSHPGFGHSHFNRSRFGHRIFRRHQHYVPTHPVWIHFPLHGYGWFSSYGDRTAVTQSQVTEPQAAQASAASPWVSVNGASEKLNVAQRVALALDFNLDPTTIDTLEVAQVNDQILLRGTVPSQAILDQVIFLVKSVPGVKVVDVSQVEISAR